MLNERDKTPAASGWGHDFHHTNPQRRVKTIIGELLVPASADDIPPVSEQAMSSVEAALRLLADQITDRDLILFFGFSPDGSVAQAAAAEARVIRRLASNGLRGILRTTP